MVWRAPTGNAAHGTTVNSNKQCPRQPCTVQTVTLIIHACIWACLCSVSQQSYFTPKCHISTLSMDHYLKYINVILSFHLVKLFSLSTYSNIFLCFEIDFTGISSCASFELIYWGFATVFKALMSQTLKSQALHTCTVRHQRVYWECVTVFKALTIAHNYYKASSNFCAGKMTEKR